MSTSSLKIRGGEVFLVALPIRRPHYWVGHSARLGEGYLVLRLELESGIIGALLCAVGVLIILLEK